MWQELLTCMGQRRVALCIPVGGEAVPLVYWYGVLAAVGIAVGAFIASKHVENEGGDPDTVWDALLWVLIPALLGARLWYVGQAVLGGSDAYSLARPLDIINPRLGGMNIFGGALFGLIALLIYVRLKRVNGWLLADGALLGLLVGQGIGRFGNFVNLELYGPPTGSDTFGLIIPQAYRLAQYDTLPPETRFHPTMLYEAAWLFLTFGVLYWLYHRYRDRMVQGVLTGLYFVMAGFGRFIMEFWRPDQPGLTMQDGQFISFSRIMSMLYVIVGLIITLDRLGYLRIPFIERPETIKQRRRTLEELQREKRRQERAREREEARIARRKARTTRIQTQTDGPDVDTTPDET